MTYVQEVTYGRGQRSRNSSTSIDYRKLAGEVSAFDYDLDTTNGDKDTNEFDKQRAYANKHIIQVLNRNYDDTSSILQTISDGKNLTAKNLVSPEHPLTLNRPMLITDTPTSIGMETFQNESNSKITILEFGKLIGMSHPVTVMDVQNQEELEGWNFGDLVDYFTDEDRLYTSRQHHGSDSQRVLNQISLEFSHTPLRKKFTSPSFVRELDWIDTAWPHSKRNRGDFPRVQYYLLTSTAGCYTDFHVDFGGTSVFYHVHSGRKTFLLIPPSEKNLTLYEKWLCSKNQNDIFFPDMEQEVAETDGYVHEVDTVNRSTSRKEKVGPVLRITIKENQTFIIPSAWIHAVYTPMDSIVVGGNFLHGLDMKLQIDVHCLETRTRVPAKFRFPSFVQLMFYAGVHYYQKMMDPNKYGAIHKQEIKGLQTLIKALKTWSVQPRDDTHVSSVPNTMKDCLAMVKGVNHNIKDWKELCLALEMELERVKTGKKRPKLKISLKRRDHHPNSKGCILSESNRVEGGGKKLKLKLKLSPVIKVDSHGDQDEKLLVADPTILSNSLVIQKRKQKKIGDLASKHNIDQGIDDEEWTPGSKRVHDRNQILEPKLHGTCPVAQQKVDLSIEEHKLNVGTLVPQSFHSSSPLKQKSIQLKVQVKKNLTTRRKGSSSVRDRLKKKFRC